jgi:hypothetical protein
MGRRPPFQHYLDMRCQRCEQQPVDIRTAAGEYRL